MKACKYLLLNRINISPASIQLVSVHHNFGRKSSQNVLQALNFLSRNVVCGFANEATDSQRQSE